VVVVVVVVVVGGEGGAAAGLVAGPADVPESTAWPRLRPTFSGGWQPSRFMTCATPRQFPSARPPKPSYWSHASQGERVMEHEREERQRGARHTLRGGATDFGAGRAASTAAGTAAAGGGAP
jgi:hypothetical protein